MNAVALAPVEREDEIDGPEVVAIEAVINRLAGSASDMERQRQSIEDRWLLDLRQYHGRYDEAVEKQLKDNKQSRLFVHLTRTKTHAWEARLSDMLFPTDDKNWGIKPTVVPSLADQAKQAVRAHEAAIAKADRETRLAGNNPEAGAASALEADKFKAEESRLRAEMEEAQRRAKAMQDEIEDQLQECEYNIRCRDALHDACKLGTGVVKGPLVKNRLRRRWEEQTGQNADGTSYTAHAMVESGDPRPDFLRVDPWSFFPDMAAGSIREAEFTFERHLMTAKELRALAKQPGFRKNAIRTLLREKSKEPLPNHVAQMRDIADGRNAPEAERYVVWEYHGPLEESDIQALLAAAGDPEMVEDFEIDPLQEMRVIVWFCQGQMLKFSPHPLESGDSLYSVFTFERDDSSIFGFGVPYLMRDSQSSINAAWRMIHDNATLSVGPQVVIDQEAVEPMDGSYRMLPRKIWFWKKGQGAAGPTQAPFQVFNIQSNQADLAAIMSLGKQLADEEINMPLMAHGEPGTRVAAPQGSQTMGGMAMLMNSVNVVFRRIVKNFDDDMTTPNIRRIYDWNMQFSPRDDIKGDMEVDARGSSVLLVRELQGQAMMAFAMNFGAHPVYGPMIKHVDVLRNIAKTQMISPDEVIKSEDEMEDDAKKMAEAAQQGAAPDPEMAKLDAQMKIAQIDADSRIQAAQFAYNAKMAELAQAGQMTVAELENKLKIEKVKNDSRERMFAAEAAITARQPPQQSTGGGSL